VREEEREEREVGVCQQSIQSSLDVQCGNERKKERRGKEWWTDDGLYTNVGCLKRPKTGTIPVQRPGSTVPGTSLPVFLSAAIVRLMLHSLTSWRVIIVDRKTR
jgi:hypothetical protein